MAECRKYKAESFFCGSSNTCGFVGEEWLIFFFLFCFVVVVEEELSIESALCFFIVQKSCAVTFAIVEQETETNSD